MPLNEAGDVHAERATGVIGSFFAVSGLSAAQFFQEFDVGHDLDAVLSAIILHLLLPKMPVEGAEHVSLARNSGCDDQIVVWIVLHYRLRLLCRGGNHESSSFDVANIPFYLVVA